MIPTSKSYHALRHVQDVRHGACTSILFGNNTLEHFSFFGRTIYLRLRWVVFSVMFTCLIICLPSAGFIVK